MSSAGSSGEKAPQQAAAATAVSAKASGEGEKAKQQRLVRYFMGIVVMNVVQWVCIVQSEPFLISKLCADKSRVPTLLGNSQAFGGILSFLFYPFMGKLTDAIGRKPGLLLSPMSNAITGSLVFFRPDSLPLVLLNRILKVFTLSFSNTVMCRTALADILAGPDLAVAFSWILAATGFATVISPQIETLTLRLFKSTRSVYAVYALTALTTVLMHLFVTPETLPKSKRVPLESAMTLQNLNPLKFLRIYTRGSGTLQKLATTYGLQQIGEGKNTHDTSTVFMTEKLDWGTPGRNGFVSLYGIEGIASGMFIAPQVIKHLSDRTYTTVANVAVGVAFLVTSRARSGWLFVLGTLLQLPGVNGVSGVAMSALASDLASAEGFGKGEFTGMLSNLRSIAGIAGPGLLGRYIAWCRSKKYDVGSAFVLLSIFSCMLPELLHQSLDYKRLRSATAKAARS